MNRKYFELHAKRLKQNKDLVYLDLKQGNPEAAALIEKHTKPSALDKAIAVGAPHIAPIIERANKRKLKR